MKAGNNPTTVKFVHRVRKNEAGQEFVRCRPLTRDFKPRHKGPRCDTYTLEATNLFVSVAGSCRGAPGAANVGRTLGGNLPSLVRRDRDGLEMHNEMRVAGLGKQRKGKNIVSGDKKGDRGGMERTRAGNLACGRCACLAHVCMLCACVKKDKAKRLFQKLPVLTAATLCVGEPHGGRW